MPVDLHTHTTRSDGTFEPTELLKLARKKNLTAIAITDHDTTSAHTGNLSDGYESDVTLVPGVELSVDAKLPGKGHLHMVGLFIDPDHALLNQTLKKLRAERQKRNQKILDRLGELGIPLSQHELKIESGNGVTGRPHIAAAMVKKGYVNTIREAFQVYLKKGSPAYIDRMRLETNQAIDLIHLSGGIAILAHPNSLGFASLKDTEDYILNLKNIGLDGIEVYCSGQNEFTSQHLLKFARKNKMVVSGGSDFHGSIIPEIELGTGDGNLNIPDEVYYDLVAYWKEKIF